MERRVISAIMHDRVAFEQLRGVLDLDDFADRARPIVEQITKFYDNDADATRIGTDVLIAHFHRNYEKHGPMFEMFINGLEEVSSPNIVSEYKEFKKQQVAMKLGQACISNQHGDISRLIELYQNTTMTESADTDIWVAPDLTDILEDVSTENMVRLVPRSLNAAIGGGVPRGSHIVVFARPEVGKSMMSINMAAGCLADGERVLYVGNEDPAPQMLARFYSRLSEMHKADIQRQPEEARRLAQARGVGNLIFAALSPGTVPEIIALVKKHKATVLVIDQFTNLSCKVDGQVEKYMYLSQQIRALGKKFNLVTISVCQAGDSASNKLILEQGDVFYSNTAIPASADLMLGLGADKNFMSQGRRMISLPKNKLNGNHEPFPVAVDPTLSKVMSL